MLRFLILVTCLLLVACGGQTAAPGTQAAEEPAQPPEVTEATTQPPEATEAQEAITWDAPYDTAYYDNPDTQQLCPEDRKADGVPVFGTVTEAVLDQQNVLIRHGLYANEQNEIFRIDVMGFTSDAVNNYADNLLLCLDHILFNTFTKEFVEATVPSEVPEPFGANQEDISTEVYLEGYLDQSLSPEQVREVLARIVALPVDQWPGMFKEFGMQTPQDAYPDKAGQDFVIAFIIDPSVGSGARHQYPEKNVSSIYATTSVRDGTGSVTAALCRNSGLLNSTLMSVTHGGSPDTLSRSDRQGSNYTYDLGVRGTGATGGRYRISGVWWMPGWSAGYWNSVPAGSLRSCNP